MKSLVTMLVFTMAFNAQARLSVLKNTVCVGHDLDTIAETISDYQTHKKFDDNQASDMLGIKFVEMIRSNSNEIDRTSTTSKTLVEYLLRPSFVEDKSLWPHFYVMCLTNSRETDRFAMKCSLQEEIIADGQRVRLKSVGVDAFDMFIEAKERTANCGRRKIQLSYEIKIDTNTKEVNDIKNAVAMNSSILRAFVDAIFDEKTFFTNYYKKFLKGWLDSL